MNTIPQEFLNKKFRKLFKNGFTASQEDIQKLIDKTGLASAVNGLFSVTGKFTEQTEKGKVIHYIVDNKHHREGGPAVIYPDGTFRYYKHGKFHRVGGPAVVASNYLMYYCNNQYHRNDGPAIIHHVFSGGNRGKFLGTYNIYYEYGNFVKVEEKLDGIEPVVY